MEVTYPQAPGHPVRIEATQVAMPKLGRGMLLGATLALVALLLLTRGGVGRLDNLFYDSMIKVHQRPANETVLIIAIDEKSLRQLGRWPWPRRTHARLLEQLTANGVDTVGFDILFSSVDSNDPQGDELLARAIENNGRVVLVLGPEAEHASGGITEILPLPGLASSAAQLAHIDFEIDSDGISRRVFLQAGLGSPHWPAMGLALLPETHSTFPGFAGHQSDRHIPDGAAWVRDKPMLIPFAGPPGHFERVSYVDVLDGKIPRTLLEGRIALIGATAVGLGDTLSTPLSNANTLMTGVEANANVLAALLEGQSVREASAAQLATIDGVLILVLLLGLSVLPARLALPGYVMGVALTFGTSLGFLFLKQIWFGPSIAFLLQTLLYFVWSWLDLGQLNRLSLRLSSQMHTQARRDRVTGLPNRQKLEERLQQILETKEDAPPGFTLLVLTMGRQHSVIDMAGIKGSDSLHKQIALRLDRALPHGSKAFRLEGGAFAVLIEDSMAVPRLRNVTARLLQSLLRPFQLGSEQFNIDPFIGASQYPQDGKKAQELLDNAYSAMHRAHNTHGRNLCFYSEDNRTRVSKQFRINQGLRNANWKDQLRCVYQPQVCVSSGRLVGVETLVRWRHAELGDVPPSEFIPVAEREGLIVDIGNWILQQACMQGQHWHETLGKVRIAVNVSAVQLVNHNLVDAVSLALIASGLPATSLELELTETAFLSGDDSTQATLNALKELGVELAIDDFGTGYSSLGYLKSFPIDRIKIDQSFVSDVHESNESAEITRSIIAMSHRLNIKVIAEGVERPEHLDYLRELECDEAQGYMVGKPMSPLELEKAIGMGHLKLESDEPLWPGRQAVVKRSSRASRARERSQRRHAKDSAYNLPTPSSVPVLKSRR